MTGPIATDSDLQLALAAFRADARKDIFSGSRYRMRYFTWGSGPPIVFIHGMADSASAFALVMHHLVDDYTCIAYELPDGTTDGSHLAKYTHNNYSDDLLEILDHLGLPKTAVLGSSFGSTIALAALWRKPERFTHGILQGGFAHRPLNIVQRNLCNVARHWSGWIADWTALFSLILQQIERRTFAGLPPGVSKFLLKNGGHTPIQAAAMRSLMFDRLDLRGVLPTIQTPVLMISGDQDPLVPRHCEYDIEVGLPHVRRVEFSGCGHYPHYSHPVPMAGAIKDFLLNAEYVHLLKSTDIGP
jgi:pimeloyl-ACP methyl ester carboxylesterase